MFKTIESFGSTPCISYLFSSTFYQLIMFAVAPVIKKIMQNINLKNSKNLKVLRHYENILANYYKYSSKYKWSFQYAVEFY